MISSSLRTLIKHLREVSGSSLRPLVWSLALNIASQGLLFVTNFALARLLGKPVFGEWAAVQSTVNTVSGIAQLSMAVTATKYVAQYRSTRPQRVEAILALCGVTTIVTGLVAGLGILVATPWLADSVLAAPQLTGPLRISAAAVFFVTITGYQVGALAGFERFRVLAILTTVTAASGLLFSVALAGPFGLVGALAGHGLAQVLGFVAHRRVLQSELSRRGLVVAWRRAREELPVLGAFTLPATLSGVTGMLGLWGVTLALVRGADGYGGMALYAASSVLRGLVLFPPAVIQRVSSAVLTGIAGAGEQARYRSALSSNVRLAFLGSAAVAVPVSLLAPFLMGFFGQGFREGGWVAAILAVSGVLEAMTLAYGQDYVTSDRMWSNLRVFAARGALLAGGSFVLAPLLGALGAAVATLLAHLVALLVTAGDARAVAAS